MESRAQHTDELNTAYYSAPGQPVTVQEVETRLSRLDKSYRDNAVAIACDYMWLRHRWKQEDIFEATQGQVTFKEYLRRLSPRGIHYCYRLEKALFVITDYLEWRRKTDLLGILGNQKYISEMEEIFDSVGISKLLLLSRECDIIDRLQATRKLVKDPHAYTMDELKLRLGKKVRRRRTAPAVTNLPPQDEMSIEDRLFLIFRDIVGEDISEDDLRNLIRRFGMDMLKEIKTKIRG